jgi:hypothetical protein
MKKVILKWKVVTGGDAYLWGVANDVYLNSEFQTVIDLQLYGIKNDTYSK